MEEMEFKM